MYKKIANTIIISIILIFSIYTIKNILYTLKWNKLKTEKQVVYQDLLKQYNALQQDINLFQHKVKGLQEDTIDLDILEIQVRKILLYYKKGEKIYYGK